MTIGTDTHEEKNQSIDPHLEVLVLDAAVRRYHRDSKADGAPYDEPSSVGGAVTPTEVTVENVHRELARYSWSATKQSDGTSYKIKLTPVDE